MAPHTYRLAGEKRGGHCAVLRLSDQQAAGLASACDGLKVVVRKGQITEIMAGARRLELSSLPEYATEVYGVRRDNTAAHLGRIRKRLIVRNWRGEQGRPTSPQKRRPDVANDIRRFQRMYREYFQLYKELEQEMNGEKLERVAVLNNELLSLKERLSKV
ncbi:hypothetical protein KL930_003643 [Ogataea haglerorum]|uniref:Uncharacterized protein n=1 Tax=Ogataea haglerorum TaxID=1937702 RepID=A0AAN6I1A8_9ASCO|nr:hypothetical protein KL913_002317 [Ogataea haglerorum]KAG7718829.1 hypothetical protein KL949_002825 [Ogataea haglerorum]KAG7727505.1 hypothetical protein KL933_002439 [Ogataea haglerorum]KAG7731219.1 hypothetical protein KL948_003499 [Ogataea haglerorum]KAG7737533.1 hypothetical protein KL923_003922 [Ogataea haglerorum]